MKVEDGLTLDVVSLLIVPRMIGHMAIERRAFRGNHEMATNWHMDSGNGWSVHRMAYVVLEPVEFVVSALE